MSMGREFLSDHAYELENNLPIKEISIPERMCKNMAQKILILGNSGTGKSASLRNFKDNEVCVINCAGKPLPFKNKFESYTPKFESLTKDVLDAMDKTTKKAIVIDDAQYIMSFQYMRRIHENGWDKWNDIQGDFFTILQACNYMPDDVIVYFLSHIATDENGFEKIKTMGKMLDEKITIEGLFTTVLKTSVQDGKYYFLTQNSGRDTVKSPIGMFDSYAIENDLKYVDTKIRNYYQIGDYVSNEAVEAMDHIAAAPEVEKPEATKRKRGRPKKNVDTGTGAIVGASLDEMKELENEEIKKTKVKEQATEKEEETAEKPKRKRKARSTTDDSADTTKENSVENGSDTEAEKPKRRRRRRNEVKESSEKLAEEISDDDLPF